MSTSRVEKIAITGMISGGILTGPMAVDGVFNDLPDRETAASTTTRTAESLGISTECLAFIRREANAQSAPSLGSENPCATFSSEDVEKVQDSEAKVGVHETERMAGYVTGALSLGFFTMAGVGVAGARRRTRRQTGANQTAVNSEIF